MDAFLRSFALVFIAEIGDKTQILALLLGLRYKRPWLIMAAITLSCLVSHGLAASFGGYLATLVPEATLRGIMAAIFAFFAVWVLLPEKADSEVMNTGRFGPFITVFLAFFLAEMGDKTQLATVALGAHFHAPLLVTLGTTLGILCADGAAVFFGESVTRLVPLRWIRYSSAALFAVFAIGAIAGF